MTKQSTGARTTPAEAVTRVLARQVHHEGVLRHPGETVTLHPDVVAALEPEGYFAPLKTDGTTGGERYMGSSPGFGLTVTSESTDVYGDDGPVAEKVISITRQVAHEFSLQCKDMTPENLALFSGGEVQTQRTPPWR